MAATPVQLLVVGGESDPNTQRVVDQAHIRDANYFYWDTDVPDADQIAWDYDHPWIDLGEHRIQPDAIFLRYNVFSSDDSVTRRAFDVVQAFALAWPAIRILNRRCLTDANPKARNLRLAKTLGMQIPSTLVMGNLNPISRMPNSDEHILKPLNGGQHTVTAADWANHDRLRSESPPMFVQEKLAGENLRVFVIGGIAFAFHLQSQALDYREDDQTQVVAIETPEAIAEPSIRLANELGFDYCALDFRCRQGFDAPVFLEINSFPMFVRFDDAGENVLADRILEVLLRARSAIPSRSG